MKNEYNINLPPVLNEKVQREAKSLRLKLERAIAPLCGGGRHLIYMQNASAFHFRESELNKRVETECWPQPFYFGLRHEVNGSYLAFQ